MDQQQPKRRTPTTAWKCLALGCSIAPFALAGVLHAQNPIIHLPFDGNANDVSGNGNHGINYGARPIADRFGNSNRALLFNGVDAYVRIPDNPGMRQPMVTLSLWVKYFDPYGDSWLSGSLAPVVLLKGPPGRAPHYDIIVEWRAQLTLVFNTVSRVTRGLNDGLWHHFVAEYGNRNLSGHIWLDGNRLTSGGVLWPGVDSILGDYYIARNISTTNPQGMYFHGAIDDIRVYSYGLSDQDVQNLYTQGGWPNVTIPAPNPRVTIQPQGSTSICPGDSVVLRATSPGAPDLYTWRVANGMNSRDTNNPTIAVRPSATATFHVTTSFGAPCPHAWDTASITITVRQAPYLPALGTVYACNGDSVTLNMTARDGTPPYRYQWRAAPGIVDPSLPT